MRTIVVSPNGGLFSGSVSTLSAALQQASHGDTIRIEAGTYVENVQIDKSVEIFGNRSATIIQGQIWITCGRVRLSDLSVCKSSECGIAISSTDPEVYIAHIRISGAAKCGIWFSDLARGTICDVEISGCGPNFAAIAMSRGANPVIRDCKIHDTPWNGIWISERACPHIEGGEIWGCGKPAILVHGAGTQPTIAKVRIRDTAENGIYFFDGAGGTVSEVEISGCGPGYSAIMVDTGAVPLIQSCRLHDTPSAGIWIKGQARPRIDGSEIWGCRDGAIQIQGAGTNPAIAKVRIHDTSGGCGSHPEQGRVRS